MMTTENVENIIRELEHPMYRMAMFFTKDQSLSRDIVQEGLLRVWKNRRKLSEIENVKAWALRITRNLCIDQSRKNKHHVAPLEAGFMVPANALQPDQTTALKDQISFVSLAMDQLSESQKMAIELREVEGYTYKEIAEIMEENINQVKILIFRARQRIKEFLVKKNEYGTG